MQKLNFISIYEVISDDKKQAFFYTIKSEKNELGFQYHILSEDENGKSKITSVKNILELLKNSNLTLKTVEKQSETYSRFISALAFALKASEHANEKTNSQVATMSLKPKNRT